jgi:hypothetical protein
MLDIRSINPDPQLSAAIAIYFARLALPVWQQKYPNDSRPEKVLETAEKVLFSGSADAADAADAAAAAGAAAAADADAAAAAADAAADAAFYAADAASAAADAADAASYAAAHAAVDAASYAASCAASCAANAAYALGKYKESFIHHHLTQLLPIILWHKLNSKRSFAEPEKVFELLPEACKEDFLFNLDSLR